MISSQSSARHLNSIQYQQVYLLLLITGCSHSVFYSGWKITRTKSGVWSGAHIIGLSCPSSASRTRVWPSKGSDFCRGWTACRHITMTAISFLRYWTAKRFPFLVFVNVDVLIWSISYPSCVNLDTWRPEAFAWCTAARMVLHHKPGFSNLILILSFSHELIKFWLKNVFFELRFN